MDKFYRPIYKDLLYCLVNTDEWSRYVANSCKEEITKYDIADIVEAVKLHQDNMRREIRCKTSTIAGLEIQVANAHNSVVMFESALADYKSCRRL